jgi:riboflavin kinase/FMN adenylyltransferase
MQVHLGLDQVLPEWPGSVVCVGTFDGVHLGHRQVIGTAVSLARERELPCVLFTFDRHPAAVLDPSRMPPCLRSLAANLERFRALGVAVSVVQPFTADFRQTSAERFLREFLIGRLRAQAVVVGQDFGFGKNREGDVSWLAARIETLSIDPVLLGSERISSTAIRTAVQEGRMEDAAAMLGEPFAAEGVVVGGERLGRQLGYPTLNLARSVRQVVPADGVYAGRAHTERGVFTAAVSVGSKPTLDGRDRVVEAHLLDYPGDLLYGSPVSVELSRRLRGQLKFESLAALQSQMAADVQAVRDVYR